MLITRSTASSEFWPESSASEEAADVSRVRPPGGVGAVEGGVEGDLLSDDTSEVEGV